LEPRPDANGSHLTAAGIVAFWPAGGTGGSVLDRALAATGDGQVLHLVYEGELHRTLVDLETGERTEMRSQHEVWFDPVAGLRETESFDGVVQFDTSPGPDEMPEHATSVYSSLGAGYREALDPGHDPGRGVDDARRRSRLRATGRHGARGRHASGAQVEPPRCGDPRT
jgi:hypothetical protein